jgi:acetate CoA/acetoacetate CoA-transferase alpha subunit
LSKIQSVEEAVSGIKDGASILISGFYGNGTPEGIIDEIIRQGQRDLLLYNNDFNTVEKGAGRLVASGQARKIVCTWYGRLPLASDLSQAGKLDMEICPQGTFAERIRAGGYGLGGVLTQTGLGTVVEAQGARRVTIDGADWLYHPPIRADFALVEARRADTAGNLRFHLAQRNFGPVMCTAADLVIAEIQSLIEPAGVFHPDDVHVPGVLVDVLVQGKGAIV